MKRIALLPLAAIIFIIGPGLAACTPSSVTVTLPATSTATVVTTATSTSTVTATSQTITVTTTVPVTITTTAPTSPITTPTTPTTMPTTPTTSTTPTTTTTNPTTTTPKTPTTIPTASATGQTYQTLASSGSTKFSSTCAVCHGTDGRGTKLCSVVMWGTGTNLGSYNGVTLFTDAAGMLSYMSSAMPLTAPGSLSSQQYIELLAYILIQANKVTPSTIFDQSALSSIAIP